MNHFGTINRQQQQKQQPPSSVSVLSSDNEMNQSYYERKCVNDEYINSLLTFIHDVEETKRYNQKKINSKVNDPWNSLMTPKTTHSKLPNFQNPPYKAPLQNYNQHQPPYHDNKAPDPPLSPKLDQKRMPLTTCRIPRRNVLVSTVQKCFKKIQQQYHQRIPSYIYVTPDEVSSTTLGYPSMRDFIPIHPDDILDMDSDWRKNRKMRATCTRTTSGAPTSTSHSTNSETTWIVSNQTSTFC